jgi:hypothetical protein
MKELLLKHREEKERNGGWTRTAVLQRTDNADHDVALDVVGPAVVRQQVKEGVGSEALGRLEQPGGRVLYPCPALVRVRVPRAALERDRRVLPSKVLEPRDEVVLGDQVWRISKRRKRERREEGNKNSTSNPWITHNTFETIVYGYKHDWIFLSWLVAKVVSCDNFGSHFSFHIDSSILDGIKSKQMVDPYSQTYIP